jgi:mono/diheme cytochrome c family protein
MTDHTAQLLRRLLGAPGPELTCEECFEELDRYVDLEVAAADADAAVPGMQAHLEGCAACHEEYLSLRAFVRSG